MKDCHGLNQCYFWLSKLATLFSWKNYPRILLRFNVKTRSQKFQSTFQDNRIVFVFISEMNDPNNFYQIRFIFLSYNFYKRQKFSFFPSNIQSAVKNWKRKEKKVSTTIFLLALAEPSPQRSPNRCLKLYCSIFSPWNKIFFKFYSILVDGEQKISHLEWNEG
jgi:hypothetical protein